jgi:ABC-type xylose transport system permease subunit
MRAIGIGRAAEIGTTLPILEISNCQKQGNVQGCQPRGALGSKSIAAAVSATSACRVGVGGIVQVVLRLVFVTMLSNGLDLLEVGGYIQQIILRGVIIATVFLDRLRTTRA